MILFYTSSNEWWFYSCHVKEMIETPATRHLNLMETLISIYNIFEWTNTRIPRTNQHTHNMIYM